MDDTAMHTWSAVEVLERGGNAVDAAIAVANLRPVISYVAQGGWRKAQNNAFVSPSINSASYALRERKTEKFLLIILSRIQVLRNQVMHGASTWNGGKNRQQIQDAAAVLRQFVPITIYIMMNDPTQEWGDPLYPVQHDDN